MTHYHHQNNFITGVDAPGTTAGATATPLSSYPSVDSPFYLIFDPLDANSHYEEVLCTSATSASVFHSATTEDHTTGEAVWMCLSASELNQISLDAETATTNAADEVPVGTIILYGSTTPPTGYLACDGSAVSRTTYASLFSLISTTFGVGDGSTTFNVPNLQGKVVATYKSTDTSFDAIAETGGAKTLNLAHSHTFNSHEHTKASSSSTAAGTHNDDDGSQTACSPGHTHTADTFSTSSVAPTSDTQLSATQSIMNKFVTIQYLIKT